MKFKIDENLPVEIAVLLSAAGHDATTVIDQGMAGAVDSHIINICLREKRVLIFCQYVLRQKDIQIELRVDSHSLSSSLFNLEEIRDHTRPGTKWVKFKIFAEDQLDEAIGLIKQTYAFSD